MAGRPPLRIGQHGRIRRTKQANGVWLAECRYRDSDGVTRKVERRGPFDEFDQYGKLAEDALIAALAERQAPGATDTVGPDTLVMALVDQHLQRLAEDGRSVATLATYTFTAEKLRKFLGGVRVREATTARLDAALRSMRTAHGATMAKQSKTILRGGLQLAVMASALTANPVRDVNTIRPKAAPKGADALTAEQVRALLIGVRASAYCAQHDLADPITLLVATGLRRSELLALQWSDFDADAATLSVTGKLVRATGHGLQRVEDTKTAAGLRTVALPKFAVDMLTARHGREYVGEQDMIFPATSGTWRDPNNFGKAWRSVREALGVPEVTSHSFRKTVATLIDDGGLSARIGADQLGHSKVSMTQDRYMARGRVHTEVADLLDAAINAE
ncbi:site-specific integrase [Mycolicibacterium frederiksbergense]|uniref:site-specific integrase n=1 Tax=Mycolicibacterium frederiksbergense TaxID=117567 RepID=UPI00265BE9AC|nr:site-specific integrase [Mycolicibacterium frederiksbergense]MDO0976016.1 site-specific integrase [Mycolicibacterium frederiksbergense]